MSEECFGKAGRYPCGVLDVPACVGEDRCPFYKPSWRFERDRRLAYERIRTLSAERRAAIAGKYMQGRTPWQEDIAP